MTTKTPTRTRRPYRRATHFTERLTLPIESDLLTALESEAEAADAAVAAVARDAIRRGLPLVRDSRRKLARNRKRTGAGA